MVAHKTRWSRFWDRLLLPPRRVRPMGLIAVQMSINPFELYMVAVIFVVGVLYLIGFPPPGAVRQLLGPMAVHLWAANLAVGGLCVLVGGLYHRNLERGLTAYQFGWGLVGVASFVYGAALFISFPVVGSYPAAGNLVFSVAAFTRVLQIQRFFKLSEQIGDLSGSAQHPAERRGERP